MNIDEDQQASPDGEPKDTNRPTRVLHIGNIANNAYLNARILNERGFGCTAVSYDYTHIMGCPEWEDADFDEFPADQANPDWNSINLNGFKRPDWFVSGPLIDCLEKLVGNETSGTVLGHARRTERVRRLISRTSVAMKKNRFISKLPWKNLALRLTYRCEAFVRRQINRVRGLAARLSRMGRDPYAGVAVPLGTEKMDCTPYIGVLPAWKAALSNFDIVIGYGLDGFIPLLAGKKPYLAFEHGTIRSFPFEDTPLGRRCAAAYRNATGALITNCDNRVAAERLGLDHYRFVPHPVNEIPPDHARVEQLQADLRGELDAEFLVFHPARQHWDPEVRHPNWEKGNDILIRGFAEFLEQTDRKAGLVMVRWGKSLEQTDALLRELGIEDRVKWVEPLPHRRMSEMVLATEVVADQFHIGAFGSLTPKGLMLGRPVLLKLDEEVHEWCFEEMPPVINTATPGEVAAGLLEMRTNPDRYRELAEASSRWYQQYHSNDLIARVLGEEIDLAIRKVASETPEAGA